MVEDRPNGLALLPIHRDVNVDMVKILDKFNTGNIRIGALHFVNYFVDIYIIMQRRKHFKNGFKVWLKYLLDLCSLVWHSKFNICVYVNKTFVLKSVVLFFL
jgi:hypothetical protein